MDGAGHLQVRAFAGNFLVVVRALTYIMTLGREGIPEAARTRCSTRTI
jgi:glycine dehydrogenase subunit 2